MVSQQGSESPTNISTPPPIPTSTFNTDSNSSSTTPPSTTMADFSSFMNNPSMKDLTVVVLPPTLKLTSSNYLAWKTQVEALLYGLDLYKFIDGSFPAPSPVIAADGSHSPHPNYPHWFRQDRLLFGAIVGSLSPPIVPLIQGVSSSCEAWQILAKTYASPSRGHIKQLKHRLKHTTKTPTQSISDYMQNIKTIIDELAILGKKMDDEDVVDSILTGLDQSTYKPILDAVHARDNPISFDELHEKLINHELSLAQQASLPNLHQPSTVFYAQSRQPNKHPMPRPNHQTYSHHVSQPQLRHQHPSYSPGLLPTPSASSHHKPFLEDPSIHFHSCLQP
ncbi:hypothetical protein E3N88_05623 [Mikania micrantha]|uniref:Retrotransposon Copia-like N-terminal domain-containing protein n=1 Tax=Mikania micrantha TaxID=192012 RepID=A0A5N6PNL2_9ASTR|nr:hypothetical protein E3N88_05623 [Mikania micrantha]